MEFNDFLNKYKEEALRIDLKKEQRLAYEILELKKMKLNSVTFDYEIDEVIAFCEEAIISTKDTLNRVIINEHYKGTYKSGIPFFLSQMKGYFEYIDLYNLAISKKEQLQHGKSNKDFNPNHFNNECYNLFNYLIDNYAKKGKVKFINIYYFLKDEVDKQKYCFNFIQDDYTLFIKENHQIEIKKYQKAQYDFIEQKRILNSLEEQFRK